MKRRWRILSRFNFLFFPSFHYSLWRKRYYESSKSLNENWIFWLLFFFITATSREEYLKQKNVRVEIRKVFVHKKDAAHVVNDEVLSLNDRKICNWITELRTCVCPVIRSAQNFKTSSWGFINLNPSKSWFSDSDVNVFTLKSPWLGWTTTTNNQHNSWTLIVSNCTLQSEMTSFHRGNSLIIGDSEELTKIRKMNVKKTGNENKKKM